MSRKLYDCDVVVDNWFDKEFISGTWVDLRWLNYFDETKKFAKVRNWCGPILIGDSEGRIKRLKGEVE